MQSISIQADEIIRQRMSGMSVSSQRYQKVLSPLEPSSQQMFHESLSLSRRGSLVDSHSNLRRPSITDMGSLPLPNSTVASRRGSIATTDYDLSSRSPSPSPFSTLKRNHENDALLSRRDSLPSNHVPSMPYDHFQRRHSIATALTDPDYSNTNGNQRSHLLNTKYRAFRFPAPIQESSTYRTYSAPPSPPQSALSNVAYQESLHDNNRFNRRDSLARASNNSGGGGPMLPSRRPSILDESLDESSAEHVLARRASMPVVTPSNRSRHPLERMPSQQPSHLHHMCDDQEEQKQLRKETPYSRSPELRVSHKLAERKRRKEMKELFDELRDSLPVEKNIKTSKWEILSKAVEYITLLKRRDYDLENEITGLRREINMIKRNKGESSHTNNQGPPFA
ncbi:uncharacterized protein B0P05DRAFT_549052 [Gilbertella persicaria]|uniref:uncharacterized protein n=1 Tax=Gilbertella persicaria TaxID=101096 RepID=UPI00221F4B22|nr:uncharacterized protein B0P05DRAFT_549052 [Gilbertella persicaria]KAI8072142.1 hypothetical protein B0P05DRAFT_549052 [Gilbertella persicaria]